MKDVRTSRRNGNAERDMQFYPFDEYIDGNTVRKVHVRKEQDDREEERRRKQKRKQNHAARKNREKAVHMNFGYVVFLVTALVIAGVVLIGYINLHAEITSSVNRIAQKESELYTLRQSNDEYETRINSSVDLEEVKRIAMGELGMKYASEGQIVNVEGGSDDYVRKYADIP